MPSPLACSTRRDESDEHSARPVIVWPGSLEINMRLRHYLFRTILGALGVAVASGMIVFLTSLLDSLFLEATAGLVRLGQNRVFVLDASPNIGAGRRTEPPTLLDALSIRARVSDVRIVAPSVVLSATLVACGRRQHVTALAVGPDTQILRRQRVATGRYIGTVDVRRSESVAVVGHSVWREFDCLRAPRSHLQIGSHSYEVVGLLAPEQRRQAEDPDYTVYIPFTTAEHRYVRASTPVSLTLTVREGADVESVARLVDRVVNRARQESGTAPLQVRTQADVLRELEGVVDRAQRLTAALLSIGLVVGAIGIVNALMTSVIERTPEIGLRRAVGATRREVGRQFLVEAVTVSSIGSASGVLAGAAMAAVTSLWLRLPVSINEEMSVFAFLAAIALGVVSGLWPAIRAAHLDPVEALRHE